MSKRYIHRLDSPRSTTLTYAVTGSATLDLTKLRIKALQIAKLKYIWHLHWISTTLCAKSTTYIIYFLLRIMAFLIQIMTVAGLRPFPRMMIRSTHFPWRRLQYLGLVIFVLIGLHFLSVLYLYYWGLVCKVSSKARRYCDKLNAYMTTGVHN